MLVVLRMPKRIHSQRNVWRDKLRKLSAAELVEFLEIRFLNDIDVAARRGKVQARMPIAADTFPEFTYQDMRMVDTVIRYFTNTLLLAGVVVSNDRKEVLAGAMAVVTTDAVATSANGKKLKSADLTKVRALLRDARRRREERRAA